MPPWTLTDAPDLTGRVAVVTGANTGLGFETALGLARQGAHVVLACRNLDKGHRALACIQAELPRGTASLRRLDLADLNSVRTFSAGVLEEHPAIDLALFNAGVMGTPLAHTRQGFELQFGTNHLGHFALGALLLPAMRDRPGARIVAVSSVVHRWGRLDFDDLNWQRRRYGRVAAYAASKLANLLFVQELQRRLGAAGAALTAWAAHPGWTATELLREATAADVATRLLAMSPAQGALTSLRAALDPDLPAGALVGPAGPWQLRGPPESVPVAPRAQDATAAARLWAASEDLNGLAYPLPAAAIAA